MNVNDKTSFLMVNSVYNLYKSNFIVLLRQEDQTIYSKQLKSVP